MVLGLVINMCFKLPFCHLALNGPETPQLDSGPLHPPTPVQRNLYQVSATVRGVNAVALEFMADEKTCFLGYIDFKWQNIFPLEGNNMNTVEIIAPQNVPSARRSGCRLTQRASWYL